MTKVTRRGYTATKEELGGEEGWKELKKKLQIVPHVGVQYGAFPQKPKPIRLYKEGASKVYLPRFAGVEHLGLPDRTMFPDHEDLPGLAFHGQLRDYQEPIVTETLRTLETTGGGVLCLACGLGKCLARDTPVMLADGKLQLVQDIVPGDLLMGDDSRPRRVLSTCVGVEDLYRVVPEDGGDPYTVNASHILTLYVQFDTPQRGWRAGMIVDVPMQDIVEDESLLIFLRGLRVPVEFPATPVTDLPYLVGYTLGSGQNIGDVSIDNYVWNSKRVRLEWLAGVLDGSGAVRVSDQEVRILVEDLDAEYEDAVLFVARTLGFAAVRTPGSMLSFRGDFSHLPSRQNARWNARPERTFDVRYPRIRIEALGAGSYYGFEIDGNRRFLLGDCTVTHNTSCSLYVASRLRKRTLVIVHKNFLLEQWVERIQQFLPEAKIGRIQGSTWEVEGCDIVIGMLQTLSMKDHPPEAFDTFGMVIVDECHHIGSDVFSQALPKVATRYMLGLSATPSRKDGLSPVFHAYLGPICFEMYRKGDSATAVRVWRLFYEAEGLEEVTNSRGQLMNSTMLTQLAEHAVRESEIYTLIRQVLTIPGEAGKRQLLVLSDRLSLLHALKRRLDASDAFEVGGRRVTSGYYIGGRGGSLKKQAEERKAAEGCDVILATYAIAAEGLDIPSLNTLLFATPIVDIEQAVGRILRKRHDVMPLVLDIQDNYAANFKRQGYRRNRFYQKNAYEVRCIGLEIMNQLGFHGAEEKSTTRREVQEPADEVDDIQFTF